MKKIFLLSALLLMGLGIKSQDTLWTTSLDTSYFYSDGGWLATDTGVVGIGGSTSYRLFGKYFFSKDKSLQIYGIAAMLAKFDLGTGNPLDTFMIDTTLDNASELVAIYAAGTDSITLMSETKRIHVRDSVPAYYLGTNLFDPVMERRNREIRGVYEVYFNEPVEVTDSFYVAITRDSWRSMNGYDAPLDTVNHRVWTAWPIGPVVYMEYFTDSTHQLQMVINEHIVGYSPTRGWEYKLYGAKTFLFPILTPREAGSDTTHVDTVGIVTLLERYTELRPNPAAERVLMTSSFGLQQIELYNAAGVKVYEQQATGYSATLDVHTLPAGPYLVRIATPRGTVTKKLIVQRR